MLKYKEIIKRFEDLVPKSLQWEKDNTGFQIGDLDQEISKILLALELDEKVIEEAILKQIDLIFTHHPLFFHPVKNIDYSDFKGNLIRKLILNNISLYSAHTNFDKVTNGVSFALAKKIGLENIRILAEEENSLFKIITFIPKDHLEKVVEALSLSGAGVIGNYDHCAFRTSGIGSFRGSENSNPFSGKKEKLEFVEEEKLEMIFPKWKLSDIIAALKNSHPYEEVAYDIIPLKNRSNETGFGAIGDLAEAIPANKFILKLKAILEAESIRVSGDLDKNIKKIAVLGGDGGYYIDHAISKQADLFLTSEISYHSFLENKDRIILVDPGHYETEIHALDELRNILNKISINEIEIVKSEIKTNSIIYL